MEDPTLVFRRLMNYPQVCVIILNWNGLEDTIECLESLKKVTYPNYEVVVVDNGSRGDDAEVLEEKFSGYIHLIRNDRNYGYTGGNNIGIQYALNHSSPDYLLILNNDIVVAPDFLGQMIKVAEDDTSIGIAGPKVYYYDVPDHIQSAGIMTSMRTGRSRVLGVKQIDTGQFETQQEVDYVSGCCLLIKKELIQKVGVFDERYFCYCEERDYCIRAERAGYKTVYVPLAKIWHKKPMQEKMWQRTPQGGHTAALSYYYWARNRFKFMRKHATKKQYRSFLAYFFGYHFWLVNAVCLLYHRDVGQFVAFCRGVRDGILKSDSGAKRYTVD